MQRIRIAEKKGEFLDLNCQLCKEAILIIKNHFEKGIAINIKFIPDYNASKILTHWHIEAEMLNDNQK